jgi:opacity protein-like surface antigen
MSKRWWMVAGALLLLCTAPSAVQAAAESVVTVTLGHQSPTGSFGDIAQAGAMAAVSGGFRVAPWLAVGADFTYFKAPGSHDGEEFDIFDPNTEKLVTITLDENWSITSLGLYGKVFLFERGRFSPYVRGGAGAYSLRYSQDVAAASAGTSVAGNEQANKFGVSGGAGVRMKIVGGTSIGIETLYHNIFARDTNVSLWTTGLIVGFGPTGN